MDGDGEDWGDMEVGDDELGDGDWDNGGDGDWDDAGDGDEDDVGMWSGEEPSVAPSSSAKDALFTVLELQGVRVKMDKKVDGVAEILSISHGEAAILLRSFRWNQQKLVDQFFNDGEDLRREYGLDANPLLVVKPVKQGDTQKVKSGGKFVQLQKQIECPQCLEDVDPADAFCLEKCGHQSCVPCWRDYLSERVEEGGRSVITPCNSYQCKLIVPDSDYDKILSSPEKVKRRRRFVLRSFVEGSKTLTWCPAPGCELAAECSQGGAIEILCKCGVYFCFGCNDYSHRPAPCEWAAKWRIKSNSEAENATWILANTKACPKCNVQIEKNQGCNHMSCRGCKHEFCWLCKGDWSSHGSATGGYYKCNLYEESKAKGETSEEEKHADSAKNALQRYLHYFQRFDNHDKAMKYAQRTLKECDDKMKELQNLKGGGFNDVQFLVTGVHQVIECRRLLKWTYCFGYYKEAGLEKQLFESLQRDLEKYCEHLHELTEKPIEDLMNDDMRATVINYTRVTNKFREQMTSGIENGLTESNV